MALTVVELWQHPVKSAQGQRVEAIDLDSAGVIGDRRWAVRDRTTDGVLTGRRCPELLFAVGGDGVVTLPSGETTSDAAVLSQWLGRDVELISVGVDRPTYEAPLDPLDGESNWVSWQGPAASFVDSTRTAVSLIATGSRRSWDHRRFRMNVVFDGAAGTDFDLVGRRVRVGAAVLDVVKRVDRCVMVTRPQPGLDRDLDVLRSVIAESGGDLGVGSMVVEPGTIRLGDTVEPID